MATDEDTDLQASSDKVSFPLSTTSSPLPPSSSLANAQPTDDLVDSIQHDPNNELGPQTSSLSTDQDISIALPLSTANRNEDSSLLSPISVLSPANDFDDAAASQSTEASPNHHPNAALTAYQPIHESPALQSISYPRRPSQNDSGNIPAIDVHFEPPDHIPLATHAFTQQKRLSGNRSRSLRSRFSRRLDSYRKPRQAKAKSLNRRASAPQIEGQRDRFQSLRSPLLICEPQKDQNTYRYL
ncbi:MAG: hypothetical protein Q9219_006032 [cf. Caloplaca sp. 3 TL-2023]